VDLTFLKVRYAERGPCTTVVIPTGKQTGGEVLLRQEQSTGPGFDGAAPADDAFLAAAVRTDAQLLVTDEPTDFADRCGALLRYADEAHHR
jgi:hypothetical protein